MELNEFLGLTKRKKQTILSVVIVFLVLTIIFTAVQPLKYSAESKLLVIQSFPVATDPYAISKSNEYLSNVLTKVIASNSFYSDVLDSGFNIDKSYFLKANREKKEMERWEKAVEARSLSDSGIITIKVFHPNKYQLNQIVQAVNYTLKTKHQLYHGLGDKVVIKVIDRPIVSSWPTKPNIALNIILAIALGLIVSFFYIYLFPEKKYNLKLWPFKKREKRNKDEKINLDNINKETREDINSIKANFSEADMSRNDWESVGRVLENKDLESNEEIKDKEEEYKDIEKGDMKNIFGQPNQGNF